MELDLDAIEVSVVQSYGSISPPVRRLLAEVRRLRERLEKVTIDCIGLEHAWSGANSDAEAYKEALTWYANQKNWTKQSYVSDTDGYPYMGREIDGDEGQRARQALGVD